MPQLFGYAEVQPLGNFEDFAAFIRHLHRGFRALDGSCVPLGSRETWGSSRWMALSYWRKLRSLSGFDSVRVNAQRTMFSSWNLVSCSSPQNAYSTPLVSYCGSPDVHAKSSSSQSENCMISLWLNCTRGRHNPIPHPETVLGLRFSRSPLPSRPTFTVVCLVPTH